MIPSSFRFLLSLYNVHNINNKYNLILQYNVIIKVLMTLIDLGLFIKNYQIKPQSLLKSPRIKIILIF